MFKNKNSKIANIITVLISILFTVILIELILRFNYKNEIKNKEVGISHIEYILSNPPALSNKNIYSKKAIKTALYFAPVEYDSVAKTWRLLDFKSDGFNIINGNRFTEYNNKDAKNFIHMFGGSTLYCQIVPDKHTVSSYLQLFVNKISKKYNVINYGVPSHMTQDQVIRLKESSLKSGDIVIFYGGNNDIAYIVGRDNRSGQGKEGGSDANAAVHNIQHYSLIQKIIIKIYYTFPKRYILKTLYRKITLPNTTGIGVHKDSIKSSVDYLSRYYSSQVLTAQKITNVKKGYFYNFLQPNLYIKNITSLSNEEKRIKKNDKLTKTSSETPYLISFPVLKKIVREELNEYSYDLTSIFDNVKDEIFTGDYIHVNHIGNEVIARSIFDVIQERINKVH